MLTVAEKVPFSELSGLLEKIGKKTPVEKKKLLKRFIDEWRAFHNKLHKDSPNTTDSFYPAMRLLLPQLERERDAYGCKETLLAKLYIEILRLGKDSPAAQKLLNYKSPKVNSAGGAGDFAEVVYYVLKPRLTDKGTMTIADVNKCLDGVALSHANKDKAGVRRDCSKTQSVGDVLMWAMSKPAHILETQLVIITSYKIMMSKRYGGRVVSQFYVPAAIYWQCCVPCLLWSKSGSSE